MTASHFAHDKRDGLIHVYAGSFIAEFTACPSGELGCAEATMKFLLMAPEQRPSPPQRMAISESTDADNFQPR